MRQGHHRSLESNRSYHVRYCIQEDIPVVRHAVGSISLENDSQHLLSLLGVVKSWNRPFDLEWSSRGLPYLVWLFGLGGF